MTIPTEVIMQMATMGLSEEQARVVADMLTAVESATAATYEAAIEEGREKGRKRWRDWKSRQPSNVSKRLPTTANVDQQLAGADAPVEDKPLTQKIEPQKTNTHAADLAAFKGALSGVCDEARVDEFVKLRRKKRGTLTGHAASLFLSDAKSCGLTVPEAIDTCISRNWITVRPEFLAGRARAGPQPPKPNSALAAADALMERLDAVSPSQTEASPPYPRLVASAGSG